MPGYLEACEWFRTAGARWFERVTGVAGHVVVSGSHYQSGDHSTPHNDCGNRRHIAFVWHLSPADWDESHGGDLVWLQPYIRFPPSFNTLYLFRGECEWE